LSAPRLPGGEGAGIRLALPGDSPALAALDALVSGNPWSAAHFEAACRGEQAAGEYALVAERGGLLAGFAVIALLLDEATLLNIAVHPAQQGRGAGRALLEAALVSMRRAGARRCLLEVRASNAVALGLYGRCGFSRDGLRRGYYPTEEGREDALLMSAQL
jgi:ribosomal-protein-alanine N-acetyltransferase